MTRTLLTLTFSLILYNSLLGQTVNDKKPKVLTVSISPKKTINAGDMISVRIRNLSSTDRGFTIEAVSLSKEPEYETAVYSAFFNADSLFFQKLKASQKLSKSKNIGYILLDYKLHPHENKANTDKLLKFVVKGKSLQKGTKLKLRVRTDIVEDQSETVYSEPMTVLVIPN